MDLEEDKELDFDEEKLDEVDDIKPYLDEEDELGLEDIAIEDDLDEELE